MMTDSTIGFDELDTLHKNDENHIKYRTIAVAALHEWKALYESDDWKNKTGPWKYETEDKTRGVKIYTINVHGNRGFATSAKISASLEHCHKVLWTDIDQVPRWNPNIAEDRTVEDIGTQTDIVYNASAEAMGGLVKSRDWTMVRTWRRVDNAVYYAGQSIDYDPMPAVHGRVRGHHYPGGTTLIQTDDPNVTEVAFFMNTDLKGYLPKTIVNKFIGGNLLEYLRLLEIEVTKK